MFISVLLWQPLQNVAATLSAHWPANALAVSMAIRMASWLWRTIRANQWDNVERQKKKNNIQIKSQIKLFVTFIPALPKKKKKKLLVFSLFSLFTMVLLFMQACDDCCLCTGCTAGREHKCLCLFFIIWTNFSQLFSQLLHCKAKALNGI